MTTTIDELRAELATVTAEADDFRRAWIVMREWAATSPRTFTGDTAEDVARAFRDAYDLARRELATVTAERDELAGALDAQRDALASCVASENALRADIAALRESSRHKCPDHAGARVACGQCYDSQAQHLMNARAERDEAREQRNRAQMDWDDEHDARLRAEKERDAIEAQLLAVSAECVETTVRMAAEADPKALHEAAVAAHGALGWGFDPNTVSPVSLARVTVSLAAEFATATAERDAAREAERELLRWWNEGDAPREQMRRVEAQRDAFAADLATEKARTDAELAARDAMVRHEMRQWVIVELLGLGPCKAADARECRAALAEHDARVAAEARVKERAEWADWPCEGDDCEHTLADVRAHDLSHPSPTSGGAWFCLRCWNAMAVRVRRVALEEASNHAEDWTCPNCDTDTAGDLAAILYHLAAKADGGAT